MRMIEIEALQSGAHRNQTYHGVLPYGWAIIPDGMDTPNYPFGDITVEFVDGVMTVTGWTPVILPEPEPEPQPEHTAQDDVDAMIVDHEYRLTLIELGVTK